MNLEIYETVGGQVDLPLTRDDVSYETRICFTIGLRKLRYLGLRDRRRRFYV